MRTIKLIICIVLFTGLYNNAQKPIPAEKQSVNILIKGGTAHIGDGQIIENALIGFINGKITLVDSLSGKADVSLYSNIINASGKHIYPGFIAANTILGLAEIDAVRATRDYTETGNFNPNTRTLIAYNTDSKIIPTVRTNGVLLVQSAPTGGWISGTSSLMQLDGWNWEDAVHTPDIGIHLNWKNEFDFRGQDLKLQGADGFNTFFSEIRKFLQDAGSYTRKPMNNTMNIRFEAMRGLYSGEKILFIHVNTAKDIITSSELAFQCGIKRIVVIGGAESYKVLPYLKQNNIAVLLRKLHSLPFSSSEDIDMPYKLPSILKEAGIIFGFEIGGESSEVRNLPFVAGTAAGYGLTYEDVVVALTLNTAKIFGVDSRLGTLAKDKDATLFISEGNALEITGNNLTHAFIQGRTLDLRNEQTELYERYIKKYGLDK